MGRTLQFAHQLTLNRPSLPPCGYLVSSLHAEHELVAIITDSQHVAVTAAGEDMELELRLHCSTTIFHEWSESSARAKKSCSHRFR
jgi:hypothetical protein